MLIQFIEQMSDENVNGIILVRYRLIAQANANLKLEYTLSSQSKLLNLRLHINSGNLCKLNS